MIPEEHEHHHGHKTGLPWLDIILAGSAMLVSVISLSVSIHHGQVMESLVDANTKMVKASTLPILDFGDANAGDEGQPVITLSLTNSGVGPAVIDWLELRWHGKPITDARPFLTDCCGTPTGWFTERAEGRTLAANETIALLTVPQTPSNTAMWQRLDAVRSEVTAKACFCSVLDECWVSDFVASRPVPVTTCAAARSGDLSAPAKAEH